MIPWGHQIKDEIDAAKAFETSVESKRLTNWSNQTCLQTCLFVVYTFYWKKSLVYVISMFINITSRFHVWSFTARTFLDK